MRKQYVLGVPFSRVTLNEVASWIEEQGRHTPPKSIFSLYANCVNLYHRNSYYRENVLQADLVLADGFGVVLASRLLGLPLLEKITTTDLAHELFRRRTLSFFFFGGREGVADRARRTMCSRYVGLQVVGTHHGYLCDPESADVLVRDINAARPDVVFVGLGTPLQEEWVIRNIHRVSARVLITCGGMFDVLNGDLKRLPKWLTDHGLEWVFRVIQRPRQVGWRYTVGNLEFLWRLAAYKLNGVFRGHWPSPL